MTDAEILSSVKNLIDVVLQGGHVKSVQDAKGLVSLYEQLRLRLLTPNNSGL